MHLLHIIAGRIHWSDECDQMSPQSPHIPSPSSPSSRYSWDSLCRGSGWKGITFPQAHLDSTSLFTCIRCTSCLPWAFLHGAEEQGAVGHCAGPTHARPRSPCRELCKSLTTEKMGKDKIFLFAPGKAVLRYSYKAFGRMKQYDEAISHT